MHSLNKIRYQFLEKTLEYASKNIAFYENIKTLDDAVLIDSKFVELNARLFLNPLVTPDYFIFTNGTSGLLKMSQHTDFSLNYIIEFTSLFNPERNANSYVLNLQGGGSGAIPKNVNNVLSIYACRKKHFQLIENLLLNGIANNGNNYVIDILCGGHTLKALTFYLLKRNFDFSKCKVKYLLYGSEHLCQRWKNIFEKYWKAEVREDFGLSEFLMASASRRDNEFYYFNATVLPEIVDWNKKIIESNIKEGIGELLLTHLYPFAQRQIFLRYRTGDIVKFKYLDNGELGFYPLGRIANSVFIDGYFAIGANEIVEILEEFPEFRREELKLYDDNNYDNLGQVIFSVYKNEIAIELMFDPMLFSDKTNYLTNEIRRKIKKVSHVDEDMIKQIVVRLVAPGAIDEDSVCRY